MCPLKCFFVLSHHIHPHALATDWNWFLKSMAYQTTVGEVTRSDIRYGWLKGLICIYWGFVYSIEWNMDYIKQWVQRTCKYLKEIRITWYTGYMESIYKPCNPSGTYLSSSWNGELFAQSTYIAKTILPKFHPYPILIHLNTVVQTSWKVVLAKSPYWKRAGSSKPAFNSQSSHAALLFIAKAFQHMAMDSSQSLHVLSSIPSPSLFGSINYICIIIHWCIGKRMKIIVSNLSL